MIKVSTLKRNPNNPRQIRGEKLELLKKSVSEFQKMMSLQPIVVDESNTVLSGNMRLAAIKSLGMKEIPDDWVKRADDLTEDEKKRLVITANSSFGEYDWDAIANDGWTDLPLNEWGLDLPEDWLNPPTVEIVEEDENAATDAIDKADELQKKWQTKSGQVWRLGNHKIICGDCTQESVVVDLMGDDKASLVWTDPPYGVKYGDKMDAANPMGYRVRSIKNDDLNDEDLEIFINKSLSLAAKSCLPGAAIYAACPAGKQLPTLIRAFDGSGFEFRWQLVWVKDSLVLSRADYHFRHENILYGWKPDAAHYFTDDRTQDSVFEVPRPKVSDEHPTMKPIPLIEQMIENSSRKGDIVYEPFSGSGSTLLACERRERACRAIELEPKYVAVTLERWANLTGKMPELLESLIK